MTVQSETAEDNNKKETIPPVSSKPEISNGEMDDETISRNRQLFFKKNKNSTKEMYTELLLLCCMTVDILLLIYLRITFLSNQCSVR